MDLLMTKKLLGLTLVITYINNINFASIKHYE